MKKKLMGIMTAFLTVGMLAGCGKEAADTPLKDMDVDKYVTLGVYKGVEVSMPPISVDTEQWDALVKEIYYDNASGVPVENGIMDRAVETGDTVNIDYEGKKDGVAFAGGTAQGANLTIGSGKFIDGFEDGLIGVMPGETVDLDLTFPENYGSADLAGQAVVFTVTVNCIMPEEMDDAIVASIGIEGVANGDELRQYVYDYLYENSEKSYNSTLRSYVMNTFMQNCVFEEIPDAMIEKYENITKTSIETDASSYGMDGDTFTNYFYGMGLEDFVTTYAEEAAKQDLAMQAVANREGLNIDDEELNTMLLSYAQGAGYDTIEEYVGETSVEDYRNYFLYDRVLDFLVENANISN